MKKQKRRTVCGVGINDADYVVCKRETVSYENGIQKQRSVWTCPFYSVWTDMLRRGYSEKFKSKWGTYRDVTVCEEWHLFSNFKKWMETQDWEGNQLDKDILVEGNKIYSPDTCCFVSNKVNMFVVDQKSTRGEYPIGVCFSPNRRRNFKAACRQLDGSSSFLGWFYTPEEAHKAYKREKYRLAIILAEQQTDVRVKDALLRKYYFSDEEEAP